MRAGYSQMRWETWVISGHWWIEQGPSEERSPLPPKLWPQGESKLWGGMGKDLERVFLISGCSDHASHWCMMCNQHPDQETEPCHPLGSPPCASLSCTLSQGKPPPWLLTIQIRFAWLKKSVTVFCFYFVIQNTRIKQKTICFIFNYMVRKTCFFFFNTMFPFPFSKLASLYFIYFGLTVWHVEP